MIRFLQFLRAAWPAYRMAQRGPDSSGWVSLQSDGQVACVVCVAYGRMAWHLANTLQAAEEAVKKANTRAQGDHRQ